MVDKYFAQRDVEYFNELLSKETDRIGEQYFCACLRMQKKDYGRRKNKRKERTKGANTENT